MSAKLIVIVLIVLMTPFILAIGALMQNRLPWSDPPGFGKRLRTYLTANIAETADDTKFPELSMRAYPLEQDRLIAVVE